MLGPIIGLLLSGSVKDTVARAKRSSVFIAIAAILLLTTYIFALVALLDWLAMRFGPFYAALIVAGITLLIAVIVLIVMASMNARDARRARERRLAAESVAAGGIGLLRSQPLLAAAVAGAFILSNLTASRRDD